MSDEKPEFKLSKLDVVVFFGIFLSLFVMPFLLFFTAYRDELINGLWRAWGGSPGMKIVAAATVVFSHAALVVGLALLLKFHKPAQRVIGAPFRTLTVAVRALWRRIAAAPWKTINWWNVSGLSGGVAWFIFGYGTALSMAEVVCGNGFLGHVGTIALLLLSYLGLVELLRPTRPSVKACLNYAHLAAQGAAAMFAVAVAHSCEWGEEVTDGMGEAIQELHEEIDQGSLPFWANLKTAILAVLGAIYFALGCLFLCIYVLIAALVLAILFVAFSTIFVICSWFGWHLLPEAWTTVASVANVVGWIVVVLGGLGTLGAIMNKLGLLSGSGGGSYSGGGGYSSSRSSNSSSSGGSSPPTPSYTPPPVSNPNPGWEYKAPDPPPPTDWAAESRKRTEEQQRWQHHKDQRGW